MKAFVSSLGGLCQLEDEPERLLVNIAAMSIVAPSFSPDTEAKLGRFDALKALHVALVRTAESGNGVEDAHGCGLVDSAKFIPGQIVPDNLLGHDYWPSARGSSGVRPMRSQSSMLRP